MYNKFNQNLFNILLNLFFFISIIEKTLARDSKISAELRTYSKFDDELKLIKNPVNLKNQIDSINNLNKILLKDDSDDVESIDAQMNDKMRRIKTSNLKISSERTDNQTNLPDLDEINHNQTQNSNLISQTTANSFNEQTNNLLIQTTANPFNEQTNSPSISYSNEATLIDYSTNQINRTRIIKNQTESNETITDQQAISTTMTNFNRNHSTTDNKLTNSLTTSEPDLSKFIPKSCYTLNELHSMNCSNCLRCPVILIANKSNDKLHLVFSNQTFNIFDFLEYETKFRTNFELMLKNEFNLSYATIIYENPFPIINQNRTILSILVVNQRLDNLNVIDKDIKKDLINATELKKIFTNNLSEIEQIFKMKIICIDTDPEIHKIKNCLFPVIKVKFEPLFIWLELLIGLVILTTLILFTILCTTRSTKRQSTKLKPFSELENNLEFHFYDFNERNDKFGSNQIRLQYLNRLSENEFNPYHLSNINGIDLNDENVIIREENLDDQLMKHQYPENSNLNCSFDKLSTNSKNLNEKPIFYNPKYEPKLHIYNEDNFCDHQFNNQKNYQKNRLSNYSNQLADQSTDCDLKFSNCHCTKLNRIDQNLTINLIDKGIKNKPPTGKVDTFNKPRSNYEIVDTKL